MSEDEDEPLRVPRLDVALEDARGVFEQVVPVVGAPRVAVVWGLRDGRTGARLRDNGGALKSIRLGQYVPRLREVRVHRRLHDVRVPEWLVGFIVYHELLHAHLEDAGHSKRFRELEARHPRAAQARAWQAAHIKSILSATWSSLANTGR